MATETAAQVAEPTKEPVYRQPSWFTGYYIDGNWYCNCPFKARCLTAKKGPKKGRIFWICPKDQDSLRQCPFSVWEEDEEEAKVYLELYGPPPPPSLVQLISTLQRPPPKTPVKQKLDNGVNPWTISKRKSVLRGASREPSDDNGEGRAPPEGAAAEEEEGFGAEAGGESDAPSTKRSRRSSTPPSGSPLKKVRPTVYTPRGSTLVGGRSFIERLEECGAGQPNHPQESLPTPETGEGSRALLAEEDADNREGRKTIPTVKLNSPINLDDFSRGSASDSDDSFTTPTKARNKSHGKKSRPRRTYEHPHDLARAIADILRAEGHVLRESTRLMIAHEVEVAMEVRDVKIKSGERTIQKLARGLDKMEDALALLDEVVDLSE